MHIIPQLLLPFVPFSSFQLKCHLPVFSTYWISLSSTTYYLDDFFGVQLVRVMHLFVCLMHLSLRASPGEGLLQILIFCVRARAHTHVREERERKDGEMNEDTTFVLIIPMLVSFPYFLLPKQNGLWELHLIAETQPEVIREHSKQPNVRK